MLLLSAQINHVNVSSQPAIVSQIVSWIVGILVNGDRIAIPVPIRDVGPIRLDHLEIVTVEPESVTIPALDMEDVTRAEPEPKLTVGKRMIDVRNMLMLNPLFPFHVRARSWDCASVWGRPV